MFSWSRREREREREGYDDKYNSHRQRSRSFSRSRSPAESYHSYRSRRRTPSPSPRRLGPVRSPRPSPSYTHPDSPPPSKRRRRNSSARSPRTARSRSPDYGERGRSGWPSSSEDKRSPVSPARSSRRDNKVIGRRSISPVSVRSHKARSVSPVNYARAPTPPPPSQLPTPSALPSVEVEVAPPELLQQPEPVAVVQELPPQKSGKNKKVVFYSLEIKTSHHPALRKKRAKTHKPSLHRLHELPSPVLSANRHPSRCRLLNRCLLPNRCFHLIRPNSLLPTNTHTPFNILAHTIHIRCLLVLWTCMEFLRCLFILLLCRCLQRKPSHHYLTDLCTRSLLILTFRWEMCTIFPRTRTSSTQRVLPLLLQVPLFQYEVLKRRNLR